MSYLLALQLTFAVTWNDVCFDNWDWAVIDYEIDGQRSKYTYNGGIRNIKK
jgi:hypothetical protein